MSGWVSRNSYRELLFGNGAVEYTLNGEPCVTDGKCGLVGVTHEATDELLGLIAKATCGFYDKWNKVDVWIAIERDLLRSLGHVTWSGTAEVSHRLEENGVTTATSMDVVVTCGSNTRSMRACFTWLFPTRARLGMVFSMFLAPLCV